MHDRIPRPAVQVFPRRADVPADAERGTEHDEGRMLRSIRPSSPPRFRLAALAQPEPARVKSAPRP
ncbi:hypothetical protein L2X99_10085 [Microbacterium sp. KUDC0406]|uniref:hypothetical protein n=1 Tax=Microbacterium sp. KUDC0406 TaxID=2909588 RepID=UPI001F3C6E89|nr:hypothetical protein [Microbacterium sp. KUDC0406]UJP08851.1 hypothetical protein L2X99_10085 [Microbacterium sp. KUDC0406]